MSCKGFTTGFFTGAILGATMGMLIDPINDRCHRKMTKTKEDMFEAFSNMVDNMMEK